jgi:hypothetical protein
LGVAFSFSHNLCQPSFISVHLCSKDCQAVAIKSEGILFKYHPIVDFLVNHGFNSG